MSKCCKKRIIDCNLQSYFFKPNWIPLHNLEIQEVSLEEIEAIRLSYLEGLNMINWWDKMWVSNATFNRIINSWITKIADAIINSKAIKINKNN
jgi:predicted DNA-binding protein (UPF0251 family)